MMRVYEEGKASDKPKDRERKVLDPILDDLIDCT